jgi:hypothetical protein
MFKYNIFELLDAYSKNKQEITFYLKNHSANTIEMYGMYGDGQTLTTDDKKILGMSIAVFLVILLINLIIFIWAIYSLVVYWKVIPDYVKVIGILGLFFPFFPVLTLILVYATKTS